MNFDIMPENKYAKMQSNDLHDIRIKLQVEKGVMFNKFNKFNQMILNGLKSFYGEFTNDECSSILKVTKRIDFDDDDHTNKKLHDDSNDKHYIMMKSDTTNKPFIFQLNSSESNPQEIDSSSLPKFGGRGRFVFSITATKTNANQMHAKHDKIFVSCKPIQILLTYSPNQQNRSIKYMMNKFFDKN